MAVVASLVKIMTLRCRESAVLLSEAQDRSLSRTERWAVRLHLLICGPCRAYRRQLDRLRQLAREALDRLERGEQLPGLGLADDARRRIRRTLDDAGE